ncbi:DJ-1/PfpI family protein [Polaromonas sp. P5_D5]
MHIAILTFDGFNELDSLIAYGMLSRISLRGDADWRVSIASPTERVTSMNGLTIDAHINLREANQADAVLIGSGMKTREVANDASILGQLQLNPQRQLIAAQCSGTFLLAKLGLVGQMPACTDLTSKPWVQAAGVSILNQAFFAKGNLATAGGCMSAQYISAWLIARLKGIDEAREVLHYFAPVGEKEEYVARGLAHLEANLQERPMTPETSGVPS